MEIEDEIKSFIKVWTMAILLVCYCYYVASRLPKGILRLVSIFPVLSIFTILPLNLSSVHLCATTAFFLAWLANFKLLLFAFDLQPLSPPLPSVFHFIAVVCLPVLIKKPENPPPEPLTNSNNSPSQNTHRPRRQPAKPEELPPVVWAGKALLLAIIVFSYEFKQYLHPQFVFFLCCCLMYLNLEITLALCSFPARVMLRLPLDRQFHEPYLSTSLQNFWGRRWNRMAPSILQPTVYNPIRTLTSPFLGRTWAHLPAVLASFTVSGLMHELLFYYLIREPPTWEATWFFVLHGVCLAVEVAVKAAFAGKVRLHPVASRTLTLMFVGATGKWLLFPPVLRHGIVEKVFNEYWISINFLKASLCSLFQK